MGASRGGARVGATLPGQSKFFPLYMGCFLLDFLLVGGGGGVAFSPCGGCFATFLYMGGGGLFWACRPPPPTKILACAHVSRLALVCESQLMLYMYMCSYRSSW